MLSVVAFDLVIVVVTSASLLSVMLYYVVVLLLYVTSFAVVYCVVKLRNLGTFLDSLIGLVVF